MQVGYYPGCSLHSMAREYEVTIRLVCERLGIKLKEIEDWNCCGATSAHSLDHGLAIGLGARNLSRAKAMGLGEVVTPCPSCFNRLATAAYELQGASDSVEEIKRLSGFATGGVEVKHILEVLYKKLDGVSREVTRPLRGLKVAAYYGCLITRPKRIARFDDPEQPKAMDELLRVLGAETITWSHKAECCGGSYAVSETNIVIDLSQQILESAKRAGADVIAVACHLCQSNLDSRQGVIEAARGVKYELPIVYLTQLMALSFGYPVRALGFKRHFVSPIPVLSKRNLV